MAVVESGIIYCLDTSVFIDGMGKRYDPRVFPSMWAHVERLIDADRIRSPQEVFEEVKRHNDEIFKWVKARKRFVHVEDDETQRIAAEVMAQFPGFVAKGNERACADPFVVAMARAHGLVVVTQEELVLRHKMTKPKIPNVCRTFDVGCIGVVDFLLRENYVAK